MSKFVAKFRKNEYDDDFSPKRNRRRDEKVEKRKIKHNYDEYDYDTNFGSSKRSNKVRKSY